MPSEFCAPFGSPLSEGAPWIRERSWEQSGVFPDETTAHAAIRHLLSCLAWLWNEPVAELTPNTMSGVPFDTKECKGRRLHSWEDFKHVAELAHPLQRHAVALYRQALLTDPLDFRFLAFFRILELGRKQSSVERWINKSVEAFADPFLAIRLDELRRRRPSIGVLLQKDRRNAIAHGKPPINPDDPIATRDISADIPIVHELARSYINKDLRVPTLGDVAQPRASTTRPRRP